MRGATLTGGLWLLLCSLVASVSSVQWYKDGRPLSAKQAVKYERVKWSAKAKPKTCLLENGFDYPASRTITYIPCLVNRTYRGGQVCSAASCCEFCKELERCGACTFWKEKNFLLEGSCWLRGFDTTASLKKRRLSSVVSSVCKVAGKLVFFVPKKNRTRLSNKSGTTPTRHTRTDQSTELDRATQAWSFLRFHLPPVPITHEKLEPEHRRIDNSMQPQPKRQIHVHPPMCKLLRLAGTIGESQKALWWHKCVDNWNFALMTNPPASYSGKTYAESVATMSGVRFFHYNRRPVFHGEV